MADNSWDFLKHRFPRAKSAVSLEDAQSKAMTKMFWIVWPDLIVNDNFNFDYEVDQWSTEYIHTFLNGEHYDGIILVPKRAKISAKEWRHRFFYKQKRNRNTGKHTATF